MWNGILKIMYNYTPIEYPSVFQPKYAGFFRRLSAYLIDIILYNLLLMIFGLYLGVFAGLFKIDISSYILLLQTPIASKFLGYVFFIMYFTFFCFFYKTSPGKYLFRLQILSDKGIKPSLISSFIRSSLQPFSMLLFGVGYVQMFKDPKKQAWHEKMAKTIVIVSSNPKSIVNVLFFYLLLIISLFTFLIVVIPLKNTLIK